MAELMNTRPRSLAAPIAVPIDRRIAFWGLAVTLSLLLFASSAPSPLYVVYQDEWGFSEITLTSVFAVYALALLAALLLAGSVSDRIGRRPALRFALVVEIVAMLLFAEAGGVGWLFAARTVQGIATGIAMGTISAALLDLQPPDQPTARGPDGRGRATLRPRRRRPRRRPPGRVRARTRPPSSSGSWPAPSRSRLLSPRCSPSRRPRERLRLSMLRPRSASPSRCDRLSSRRSPAWPRAGRSAAWSSRSAPR